MADPVFLVCTFAVDFNFTTSIFGIYYPQDLIAIGAFDFEPKNAFHLLDEVGTVVLQCFSNTIKNDGRFEVFQNSQKRLLLAVPFCRNATKRTKEGERDLPGFP